ncbi:hypothetical protein P9E34_14265 [Schinkia azotoformans]|uniref:hypothetical protein n=1 Tax=Schinkia azotoformans TaxID=1454 RepID=UPI002DC02E69|nr:hypothetical protein [Schinkia azotoformans]MEC1725879.1 hypothetical protein [Schinkia azotoformans]
MSKVEIVLKNGETIMIDIAEEGHACIEDIFYCIDAAKNDEEEFVKFNEAMIKIDQIAVVRLAD